MSPPAGTSSGSGCLSCCSSSRSPSDPQSEPAVLPALSSSLSHGRPARVGSVLGLLGALCDTAAEPRDRTQETLFKQLELLSDFFIIYNNALPQCVVVFSLNCDALMNLKYFLKIYIIIIIIKEQIIK